MFSLSDYLNEHKRQQESQAVGCQALTQSSESKVMVNHWHKESERAAPPLNPVPMRWFGRRRTAGPRD